MKRITTLSLIIFFSAICLFAQQKELTLRQVTIESRSIYPQRLIQLKWITGTDRYSYVSEYGKDGALISGKISANNRDTILTLSTLNSSLKDAGIDDLKSFPSIDWINENIFKFRDGSKFIEYSLTENSAKIICTTDEKAENVDFSSKDYAAYTIKNNLFIAVGNEQQPVTFDTNEGIVNGQLVARNEFGIYKGTFWSPSSDYLAFYRKDQTMVTNYPLVDINTRPASLVNIKYPMAGMTSEQSKLGIYNLKTNEITYVQTGEPKDHYLPCVTWDPSEKYIYIAILNRDQNHLWLNKYNAGNGEFVKTLFEETNDKYVQPLNDLKFVPNHPNEFIWISRRDGWNHLYLYSTDGKLIRKLTKGEWEVTGFNGYDSQGNTAYFTSTKESPLERDYYSVNLYNGDIIRITSTHGVHRVERSSDSKYFLDTYSNLETPNKSLIENADGKVVETLFTAENPLKDYKTGAIKFLTLKSSDGFDLYCRMYFPPDFDQTKKYPVMVYVYGGPGVQLITDRWLGGGYPWFEYMAEQGYIVFTLDNRGSANRGLKFEQETFRHLGAKEIEDQIKGVDYLKSLAYVDSTRLGVFGWSYGGFMTTSLMTRTPGVFKVGVAGGAVINWKYYEVMYTERYMDTPQANPEGYDESNLLNYVGNLKGKFLMVNGTEDKTVVWQHTLMFLKKAADLDIPVDYYAYPGQEHGVRGIDVLHLYTKITNFLNDNL